MAAFVCPSADDVAGQLVRLLPRGRAWRTHEGGPEPASGLWRFWRAVAEPWAFVHERLCQLRRELWCATHAETHDVWMAEYGLPDACDPFPDLCAKVAAIGGTRCDYLAAIAARAGWVITCMDAFPCGARSRVGRIQAGCARAGRNIKPAHLVVVVHVNDSAAYVARQTPSQAGRLRAGRPLACAPDIYPVKCLIERIVHAEVAVDYAVDDGAGPTILLPMLDFSQPGNAVHLGLI